MDTSPDDGLPSSAEEIKSLLQTTIAEEKTLAEKNYKRRR